MMTTLNGAWMILEPEPRTSVLGDRFDRPCKFATGMAAFTAASAACALAPDAGWLIAVRAVQGYRRRRRPDP